MRPSTFFYSLGQGIKNIFRNKWYSLASIATISACLFLFGLFFAILQNFENMVKTAEEGVSVTAFFDEGLSEENIADIGEKIQRRTEVAKVVYVSAEEAWDSFKEDYLKEYADGFPENPLSESAHYEIYLRDVSQQDRLVTYLESLDGIRKVNKSKVVASTLSALNNLVGYISIAIIAILFVVSIFLISNTVMIGISVRKEEIMIMKYIGATDFFVRAPFVFEGMIIGAVGSLIPMLVIYELYNKITLYIGARFSALSNLLSFLTVNEIFDTLLPISLVIGVGIGFIGSFTTVKKHLRV